MDNQSNYLMSFGVWKTSRDLRSRKKTSQRSLYSSYEAIRKTQKRFLGIIFIKVLLYNLITVSTTLLTI